MEPIHPLSGPVPSLASRKPPCGQPSGRKARRRCRKARLRCRLSHEQCFQLRARHLAHAQQFATAAGVENPGAVADAAMSESLRVYRRRKGEFRPLLFLILRWRVLSAYREEARHRSVLVPLSALAVDVEFPVESSDPYGERPELEAEFLRAWRSLDRIERQLLYLHYVEGRQFSFIQKLEPFCRRQWAVVTLRAKAYRALRKLRARLQSFRDAPDSVWLLVLQSISLVEAAPRKRALNRKSLPSSLPRCNTTTSGSGFIP